jgi:hypothetical protein
LAYLYTPVGAFFLFFSSLIVGLAPKFSSNYVSIDIDIDVQERGFFIRLSKAYFNLSKSFLVGSIEHGLIFFPIALIVSIVCVPVALLFSLILIALSIFDVLGWLVEKIRMTVANNSMSLAKNVGNNTFTAIIFPALLILLFPIYIALLLIPKFSTYDTGN